MAETLHDEAEKLAGKLSLRQLTPQECAEGVDIIFELPAENHWLHDRISQMQRDRWVKHGG